MDDLERRKSAAEMALEAKSTAERRRRVRRARVTTLSVVCVALVSILLHGAHSVASRSAVRAAQAAKEACWPLAGGRVNAVVLLNGNTSKTLWWPRYTVDPATSELLRTRETSSVCVASRVRIRQKHVTIHHATGAVSVSGTAAVCLMHMSDYFVNRTCN